MHANRSASPALRERGRPTTSIDVSAGCGPAIRCSPAGVVVPLRHGRDMRSRTAPLRAVDVAGRLSCGARG